MWAWRRAPKPAQRYLSRPRPQFFERFSSNAILTQLSQIGKQSFRIQYTMTNDAHRLPPIGAAAPAAASGSVTAIVPARNEEAVIAACIASLASQPEIGEILVLNAESSAGTATVVKSPMGTAPTWRL